MKEYIVRHITDWDRVAKDPVGKRFGFPGGLEEAAINVFPWDKGDGFRPVSGARLGWDDKGLHIFMYTLIKEIRAEVTQFCGPVCTDDCLEAFINPNPEQENYFNYECNARPCEYFSVGKGRHGRDLPEELPAGLESEIRIIKGYGFSTRYTIPAEYLRGTFGVQLAEGRVMMGNFYKCGDDTARPHWGCWNPIDTNAYPEPDYHRPEYFGKLILG